MSLQKFSSGVKKKLKRRFGGGRHEPEGLGADIGGESVDSIRSSLSQSEHLTTAKHEGDHPQSSSKIDVGGGRVDLREALAGEGGTSESGLHLGLGLERAMEKGPSQGGNSVGREEADQVDPPPSASPIVPDSM